MYTEQEIREINKQYQSIFHMPDEVIDEWFESIVSIACDWLEMHKDIMHIIEVGFLDENGDVSDSYDNSFVWGFQRKLADYDAKQMKEQHGFVPTLTRFQKWDERVNKLGLSIMDSGASYGGFMRDIQVELWRRHRTNIPKSSPHNE